MNSKFKLSVILIVISFTINAQTNEKPTFSVCNHTQSITLAELNSCGQLTSSDTNVKVKSYTIALQVFICDFETDIWDSTIYVVSYIIGSTFRNENELDSRNGELIIKYLKVGNILEFRDIVCIENNAEKKYPTYSIVIK